MMMYMNKDTGALMREEEMLADWQDNYDGWDDSNLLDFTEQYVAVEIPDEEKECDFTDEQIRRIDEVENAAYDFCRVLTENEDLDWDAEYVCEIADLATEILVGCGFRIRYPYRTEGIDGRLHIKDYFEREGA